MSVVGFPTSLCSLVILLAGGGGSGVRTPQGLCIHLTHPTICPYMVYSQDTARIMSLKKIYILNEESCIIKG
jgi:hypothetical protein